MSAAPPPLVFTFTSLPRANVTEVSEKGSKFGLVSVGISSNYKVFLGNCTGLMFSIQLVY